VLRGRKNVHPGDDDAVLYFNGTRWLGRQQNKKCSIILIQEGLHP